MRAAFANGANCQRLAYLILLIDFWRAYDFALHRYSGEVLALDWTTIISAAFKLSIVTFTSGVADRCLLLEEARDAKRPSMKIKGYAMFVAWRSPFNQIVSVTRSPWRALPVVSSLEAKRAATSTATTFVVIRCAFAFPILSSRRVRLISTESGASKARARVRIGRFAKIANSWVKNNIELALKCGLFVISESTSVASASTSKRPAADDEQPTPKKTPLRRSRKNARTAARDAAVVRRKLSVCHFCLFLYVEIQVLGVFRWSRCRIYRRMCHTTCGNKWTRAALRSTFHM